MQPSAAHDCAGDAQPRDLLRFLTCGSVDDGKSTLIGRLLHDSDQILDDHLAALRKDSSRHGTTGTDTDLALLVDGLEAEREQGITIDVAYRYFSTAHRSFIVADTPGHEQYTRNMATGASTADAAIVLVDARKGLLTQTRRHSYICSLLGVRSVVLAVNKMDLLDYSEDVFRRIADGYREFTAAMGFQHITAVPVSARHGDNVVTRSSAMPWYTGPSILECLEKIDNGSGLGEEAFRFPVQWVNRPHAEFRGYAGRVASGSIRVGEKISVAGSPHATHVARIATFDGDQTEARAGQSVTLLFKDEIDVAVGDTLCATSAPPEVVDHVSAHLLWMASEPMLPGRTYLMRHGTATIPARVSTLEHIVDIDTLQQRPGRTLALNEIALCNVAMARPIAIDSYARNRIMGAFVLIDRATNATVGAGMIVSSLQRAQNLHRAAHTIDKKARAALSNQKPAVVWFTGLSGSGKSTIADLVEQGLHARGVHTMLLDGDSLRHGLNSDLGFSDADRVENIRRVGHIAKLFVDAGLVVICCFISPFAQEREMVAGLVDQDEFFEVFVDVPIEECIRRDPKGLYAKALAGKITNFTGVDSPYEPPLDPAIRIDGMRETAEDAASRVIAGILDRRSHP